MAAKKGKRKGGAAGAKPDGKEKKLSLEERLHKAFSHPTRVTILDLLNMGEWSPRGLQRELDAGLSFVSYHVKVLRDFELIEQTRTEPRRGAVEHFYTAVARAQVPAGMAKNMPKSAQKIVGNGILERINQDTSASLKSGQFYARDDWHTSWTPGEFDGQACEDAERLADEFIQKFIGLGADSDSRRTAGEGDGARIPVAAGLLIFGSSMAAKGTTPLRRTGKKQKEDK